MELEVPSRMTRIEHSEIYSNTAFEHGGGIYTDPNSPLTILDSKLHNNSANSNGGAITIYTTLVISDTVLEANHAALKGGGIYHRSLQVMTTSQLAGVRSATTRRSTGGAIGLRKPLPAQTS